MECLLSEPVQGRLGFEVKAQHRDKEDEEVVANGSQLRESEPRGIYISKT